MSVREEQRTRAKAEASDERDDGMGVNGLYVKWRVEL